MNYKDLTEFIATTAIPRYKYYELIVNNRQEVLARIKETNQTVVAKELGISQAKLSTIVAILEVL